MEIGEQFQRRGDASVSNDRSTVVRRAYKSGGETSFSTARGCPNVAAPLETKSLVRHCARLSPGFMFHDEQCGRVSREGGTLPTYGGPGCEPGRQGNVASTCRGLVANGGFPRAI